MASWKTIFLVLLAIGVAVCAKSYPRVPPEEADFIRCFEGQPAPDELRGRLRKALGRHTGNPVEDDIRLALAQAEISAGHAEKAVRMLESLAGDTQAVKLHMTYFWRGGMLAGEAVLVSEVSKHYNRFPDFTSDHALVTLAHGYRRLGKIEKSWQTFEKLRKKYPRGDRVQEDLHFMDEFRKEHPELPRRLGSGPQFSPPKLPEGGEMVTFKVPEAVAEARSFSELFLVRRRPHLRGLQEQAALCHKMGRRSEERVAILKDILTIYNRLLTPEELTTYCKQGLAEIESLEGKAEGEALERLKEARKVFDGALKGLIAEKTEPLGPAG